MKFSLSKVGLIFSLPFFLVVLFDAYQIAESSNGDPRSNIFMFIGAGEPWKSILNPIFTKIYVYIGSRTIEPMYFYWLVCVGINAFLAYLIGASINVKKISKAGAVLASFYLIVCSVTWALVLISVKTANLSGVYLILISGPFAIFLTLLFGQFGIIIAMLFNSALLYGIGALLSKTALKIKYKYKLSSNNVHT